MQGVGGDSPDRAPVGSTAGGGTSLQPPEQGSGPRTWAAAGSQLGRGSSPLLGKLQVQVPSCVVDPGRSLGT